MKKSAPLAMTPEQLQTMIDLLPHATSVRDIALMLGLQQSTVNAYAQPFIAIMKIQGNMPQCGCGKDRFHPYGCADSYAKSWPSDCIPGRTRAETVKLLERRQTALALLVAGDRLVDIDKALGMPKGAAKSYLRFLTPDQAAHRDRHQRERGITPRSKAPPPRPFSDPPYAGRGLRRRSAGTAHRVRPALPTTTMNRSMVCD